MKSDESPVAGLVENSFQVADICLLVNTLPGLAYFALTYSLTDVTSSYNR